MMIIITIISVFMFESDFLFKPQVFQRLLNEIFVHLQSVQLGSLETTVQCCVSHHLMDVRVLSNVTAQYAIILQDVFLLQSPRVLIQVKIGGYFSLINAINVIIYISLRQTLIKLVIQNLKLSQMSKRAARSQF